MTVPTNDAGAEKEIEIDDEDVSAVDLPAAPKDGETPIDWEERAKHFQGIATRRGTKLSKLKAAPKTKAGEETPAAPQANKAGELGYAEKAYLASNFEVKHPDDVKFVQSAMKETGRSLDEVMASPFVLGGLKEQQEARTTKEGTPSATGDRSGTHAVTTVDYWINKGELPPKDQPDLRRQVVAEKIKRQRSGAPFAGK